MYVCMYVISMGSNPYRQSYGGETWWVRKMFHGQWGQILTDSRMEVMVGGVFIRCRNVEGQLGSSKVKWNGSNPYRYTYGNETWWDCIQKYSKEQNIRVFPHICAQTSHNWSINQALKTKYQQQDFHQFAINDQNNKTSQRSRSPMLDGVYLSARCTGYLSISMLILILLSHVQFACKVISSFSLLKIVLRISSFIAQLLETLCTLTIQQVASEASVLASAS